MTDIVLQDKEGEQLKKWIAHYWKIALVIVVLIVIGIIVGYSVYQHRVRHIESASNLYDQLNAAVSKFKNPGLPAFHESDQSNLALPAEWGIAQELQKDYP